MQPVSSFPHDDGARGVALCRGIKTVLEQGFTSEVGDELPLSQLTLIVRSCSNAGWGTSRSGPAIYLVLPVNYKKHHVAWFNCSQWCSGMIEIWGGRRSL